VRRVRLVLEYDGGGFHGFQRQKAARTVQGELEAALATVCGHPVETTGAGRTDTGVHALGQVVHFDTTGRIPIRQMELAVNSRLPRAMAVRCVEECGPEFHARFGAVSRTYHYYLARARPTPMRAPYVVHRPRLLPEAAGRMLDAMEPVVGTHDFAPFAGRGEPGAGTVRTLLAAGVEEAGGLVCLSFTANAFLHSMVRLLVGELIWIGSGRREPGALQAALERRETPLRWAAPACGLFLMRVDYPDGYPGAARNAPFSAGRDPVGGG